MTYEQVLDQLKKEHPQQEKIAIPLLDSLSLLATSGVPTHWLLKLHDDSDAVRDTLSFLKRSSIIQESADGDKTIIHRLQGQVYRETYLSDCKKIIEASTHAITTLNRVSIKQVIGFEQKRQETRNLVEQIRSITSQEYSHPLPSDPNFTLGIATTLSFAAILGMPQLALSLAESVALAADTLGPDHPHALGSRNNLANAYQDVGRLDEAITLHKQTLDARTRTLGPNHPDTLGSGDNLACAYREAGRLDEAITLHKQTLDARTHILGPNHPDTLDSCHNLAVAYRDAGRLDEAIALYEQNLEDHTRILGPHHPNTLATRNNLAIAYHNASRLDEAIALFEQNLEDRTRILGPHHPDTLLSRDNLASTYRAAGRFKDADKLFETPSDSDDDEQNGTEEDPDQQTDD